uniref:Uncharacterized protein n=1 Tax=Brassica oleracea var. oleracea TaxID=109376 RepID=A0A0D3B6V4_BRAOL
PIASVIRDVNGSGGCVAVSDVWCSKGLGFSTDAVSMILRGGIFRRRVATRGQEQFEPNRGDKLLLRVRGAPLALIHVSSSDPLPHLSIKNTPIETSSAQFIHQRYTAASSGQKLQNSIISAYGEAQDDH